MSFGTECKNLCGWSYRDGWVGHSKGIKKQGYENIITASHKELDLTRQEAVEDFFKHTQPEYVFHPAGKVGGIVANNESPADFMYENMMMEMNVIHRIESEMR